MSEKTKKKLDFSSYAKVVGLFTLEIVALISFCIGNSFLFYTILSAVLLALIVLVTINQFNKDGFTSYAFFLFPLFIFGLLSALSNFTIDESFSLFGNIKYIIPLGLSCFAACGYFSSTMQSFKLKPVLTVVYSALAALTIINLLATMIEFKPFYTFLYRNKYLYYYGKPSESPISEMAFALMGFATKEVSVAYFSLFPSVLVSAFVPLSFCSFKTDKKEFLLYLAFGLIGIIALLFTVSIMTIFTDVLLLVFIPLLINAIKHHWKWKYVKLAVYPMVVIFALLLVAVFLNSQLDKTGFYLTFRNAISGNAILNKLFNANNIVVQYNAIMDDIFGIKLFGFPHFPKNSLYNYPDGIYPTNSLIFDIFMFSGVFGWLFFVVTLVVGIRTIVNYFHNGNDTTFEKAGLSAIVFSFYIYSTLNYDSTPYIFNNEISPVYLNGVFLVTLFLMSYAFGKTIKPKEETKDDKVEENKKEVQNEEASL